MALATAAGLCFGGEGKVIATVADVKGKCLLDKNWTAVAGNYVYWEINSSGRASRWHKSKLIYPERASNEGLPEDSTALRSPFAFSINLPSLSITSTIAEAFPELIFRDAMRKKLNKPNLVAATVVQLVPNTELFNYNLTSDKNPFRKDDWESKFYVPTQYAVCDLEIIYLMNRAEAIFETRIFGKTIFKSNQTVPLKDGQLTFAEEILSR
jgi:hypothetical protein